MSNGPLNGVRVVEFAGIGPGPCAAMMLADMGAEVIIVDRKVANANAAQTGDGAQPFINRGKKSIALNLKDPASTEAALKLIDTADILLEGFRAGVMERLGLGPDVCLARNPKLVYGRLTGWGQTGPLAHAAGHDPNYIGISGAAFYAGRKDHGPAAPLTLVGDIAGGTMNYLFGVLCAYINVLKTGEGQVVDAAITDGSAYVSSLLMMMRNAGQINDEHETGWVDGAAPWNDVYLCADGKYVNICPLEPNFYAEFLTRVGLAEDEAFKKQWDKSQWPAGKEKLKALFASKTQQEWCDLLEGTDACFAPVLSFAEAAEHPHNKARGTFLKIDGQLQPAPAPKFSVSKPTVGAVPSVGQDTEVILGSLGIDPATLG